MVCRKGSGKFVSPTNMPHQDGHVRDYQTPHRVDSHGKEIRSRFDPRFHPRVLPPTALPKEMSRPSSALQWVARSPSHSPSRLATPQANSAKALNPKKTNSPTAWNGTHCCGCEEVVLLDALRLWAIAPRCLREDREEGGGEREREGDRETERQAERDREMRVELVRHGCSSDFWTEGLGS